MASVKEQEEWILAVHPSARVRGAIHRGLSSAERFSVTLCSDVPEARALVATSVPSVALLRFGDDTLDWALALYCRHLVPIVFTFVKGADMTRSADARAMGLVHFVELPGDSPASWACQAQRLEATMVKAVASNQKRRDKFGRATTVQPVIASDLLATMASPYSPEPISDSESPNLGVTSILTPITKQELVENCAATGEFSVEATAKTSDNIDGKHAKKVGAAGKKAESKKRKRKKRSSKKRRAVSS